MVGGEDSSKCQRLLSVCRCTVASHGRFMKRRTDRHLSMTHYLTNSCYMLYKPLHRFACQTEDLRRQFPSGNPTSLEDCYVRHIVVSFIVFFLHKRMCENITLDICDMGSFYQQKLSTSHAHMQSYTCTRAYKHAPTHSLQNA